MRFLGKEISGPFTLPSGIITTNIKTIRRIAKDIPEVGVITTKSIGPEPRAGNNEPIITQYGPGCFMNAVGLMNPGAEEFAKHLDTLHLPDDRFLLISIFGKDKDEFVKVAKLMERYADGLELNLSCPHASGYGMAIGQDPKAVKEITAAVKAAVKIPIIPKLTPNTDNIAEIARAAVEGGADAICAINTVGPGYHTQHGKPVLTNVKGGMSGKGILPIGLKCVKEITDAVDIPVIGCGGISTAADVSAYKDAGATICGIGSALADLSTKELKLYFAALKDDIDHDTDNASKILRDSDMSFKRYILTDNKKISDKVSVLVFNKRYDIKPGQFIFAWMPGIGEKPFSILDDNPLTLAVENRGRCTSKLVDLKKGDELFFRGPYGRPVNVRPDQKPMIISGGCGLAAVYQIARDFKGSEIFIGAKDKQNLFYIEKAKAHATVHISTDDGSAGHDGFVTDLLKKRLEELGKDNNYVFFNCGPRPMMEAATRIQQQYTTNDNIYNSVDYTTKCGVGLCGGCTSEDGRRLCVDGPFMRKEQ
ncbi:tRNA-dihydrouridine synthase [Nanoarchaeota archaeon]